MNSSTGATAKTIDDPATGPMNPLDSLGITQIPAEDEALRPQVRAFLAQAIKDLPPHQRARWASAAGLASPCRAHMAALAAARLRAMCWWRNSSTSARPWARIGSPIAKAAR